jgi:hypothetical protein
MGNEASYIVVTSVPRDCHFCRHVRRDSGVARGYAMCGLCAGLVRSEDGRLWIFAGGIEGSEPFRAPREKLSPAPRSLW